MSNRCARRTSRGFAKATASALLLLAGCNGSGTGSSEVGTARVAVHIAIPGEGGSVRSADPAFDCSAASCTEQVARGLLLHLAAVPEARATFQGWGGACSGQGPCDLLADHDLDVTATFARAPPAVLGVEVQIEGEGDVRSTPAGIDCGQVCSATFAADAIVSLAPAPHPGFLFAGWSGACSGLGACRLGPANESLSVTVHAAFVLLAPDHHAITVSVTGNGTVRSVPEGIDCGNTCSASFASGTVVQLTPLSGTGSRFTGWAGACAGTDLCTLTLDGDAQLSAAFEPPPPPPLAVLLAVRRTGSGTGRVVSTPDGIACGDACSATFAGGTVVTLSQTPAEGSRFAGWSGACSGSGSCVVALAAPAEVAADFAALPPPGISIHVTHVDPIHNLLAVAPNGTAYGTSNEDDGAVVYASTDNSRTWIRRGRASARVVRMTALSDGVLLADVEASGIATIERSGDGGATWIAVLPLGRSRTLSPHSFDERNGIVYLGEYQSFTQDAVPVHLWSSADRGRTWTVVHVFSGYTHAHAVRIDPDSGAIWMFMGDKAMSALLRSLDGGATWATMLSGEAQARVVDAVFTPAGLLYGLDAGPPFAPGIFRLAPDGTVTRLANLPSQSYSIHAMRAGGFLVGTTREPLDVYPPPGEENTYVYGSADGESWSELARFPRIDPGGYASADVYWELASGEAVIHLYDVEPMWYGEAYMLATVDHAGASSSRTKGHPPSAPLTSPSALEH